MVARKTEKKKPKRIALRRASRASLPAGTVTVTISLEHVFTALRALAKGLEQPANLHALRSMLDQALSQMAQKDQRTKKKPARDPNLN